MKPGAEMVRMLKAFARANAKMPCKCGITNGAFAIHHDCGAHKKKFDERGKERGDGEE